MNDDFIAGFICGEGYFYKQFVNSKKNMGFGIGIHMDKCDIDLLKEISIYMNIGHYRIRKNGNPVYIISKASEIFQFIERFEHKLKGNKLKQYLIWKDIFTEYHSKKKEYYKR